MGDRLKVFVLAGEASGDRIGAALVADLGERVPVEIAGVGGPALAAAGLKSLFPMENLAVMGLAAALKRLPLLLWRLRQTVAAIRRWRPDIVVLVDAQEFSVRVARAVRRFDPDVPIVLYVAPTVWGWRPERAREIAPLYTEVLAVLPFEPDVMARLGGPPTTYVGHPAVDALGAGAGLARDERLVVLMPGSRPAELRLHLPIVLGTAALMKRAEPQLRFGLPTVPSQAARVARAVRASGIEIEVAAEREAADALLRRGAVALAAFGTATLELAAADTPMVGFFDSTPVPPRLKAQLRGRFLALPNIVLDEAVVAEIVADGLDASRLAEAMLALWRDPAARAAQQSAFAGLRKLMAEGAPEAPRQRAVDRILALVGRGG